MAMMTPRFRKRAPDHAPQGNSSERWAQGGFAHELPARLGHPDGRSALSESYDGDKTKLSPRQHRVLAAICAAPRGLPCEALPEQVGMNPRDVATIVAGLVDAGAIHQGTVNGAPVYKWGYRA